MRRFIPLVFLLGCQTKEPCPEVVPCGVCLADEINYDNVALEECEKRLSVCADSRTDVAHELKACKAKVSKKKKRGKK